MAFPLVPVLAAGLIFLVGSKPKKTKAPAVAWEINPAGGSNGTAFFDVFAPAGSFGPHQRLYVMRFSRTGDGPPVYKSHDATTESIAPAILNQAIQDLGITGAALATRK